MGKGFLLDLFSVINHLSYLDLSIIFEFLLSFHRNQLSVFLVNLLNHVLHLLAIDCLVMAGLRVKLPIILRTFFLAFFYRFGFLSFFGLFDFFCLVSKDGVDFLLEILKETVESIIFIRPRFFGFSDG